MKNIKFKIGSLSLLVLMVLQLCFFCPCTYAAHNRLMEILGDSEDLTVEDIKPIVEKKPFLLKETYSGKNKKRKTVLYYALYKGENANENRAAIAQYLIEKGTKVGPMWKDGDTPLHWAASVGQDAFLRWLLQKGSDPNKVNGDGETPLQLAKKNNHASTVKLLKSHVAEKAAAESEVAEPVPAAVPECDMTTKGTIDNLNAAARDGNLYKVRLLLESGIDPNQGDEDGWTPLMFAAKRGSDACVRLLLEKGADPNKGNQDGRTPLQFAVLYGHETCVRLLLEKGADPNKGNRFWTPLRWAAFFGRDVCVRLLLEKGADPNEVYNGITSLNWAAWRGHKACVQLLLEKRADPNCKDKYGKTPLDVCCTSIFSDQSHKDAIEALLKAHGGKNGSQL